MAFSLGGVSGSALERPPATSLSRSARGGWIGRLPNQDKRDYIQGDVPRKHPKAGHRIDPELRFWILVVHAFIGIGVLPDFFWGSL